MISFFQYYWVYFKNEINSNNKNNNTIMKREVKRKETQEVTGEQ